MPKPDAQLQQPTPRHSPVPGKSRLPNSAGMVKDVSTEGLKRCGKCRQWKEADGGFSVDRQRRDGLAQYCRACAKIKNAKARGRGPWGPYPCTPFAVRAEKGKYVLCSVSPMARRPHDEIPGHKRGYEPSGHPIWARRVRRMLTAFVSGPLTARELEAVLRVTKLWNQVYTVNVLIAAQELELVAYDGAKWHAHMPGAPLPPQVKKPKAPGLDPQDDLYPDQLPL